MDVYWDEAKVWLCSQPGMDEASSSEEDIKAEAERLARGKEQENQEDFEAILPNQVIPHA